MAPHNHPVLEALRASTPTDELVKIDRLWEHRQYVIEWPTRSILFAPGATAHHLIQFTRQQKFECRLSGVCPKRHGAGLVVTTFKLAGGTQPTRRFSGIPWEVKNIYNGKHPVSTSMETLDARDDGEHYTQSAGLLALHQPPTWFLDSLPYFAWILRVAAYERFGYDPDNVLKRVAA